MGVRPRQEVEDLVGAAGDEAKAASVLPAEPVLDVVGIQEAVACKMAEPSPSDGVLEVLQELVGEGGGFVKAEEGSGIGGPRIRLTLNPLEEPVDYAQVEMEPSGPGGVMREALRAGFPRDHRRKRS